MSLLSTTSVDPPARFRLLTLGPPHLGRVSPHAPSEVVLAAGKPLALLTYLAFAPRRVASRDTLCDLLWGNRDIEGAQGQLRQTLFLIKRRAGRALAERTAEGIALTADIEVDAHEFMAAIAENDLERAIGLYAGDFLSGFASPGAGRLEQWAELERHRLRAHFAHAVESLALRQLDRGRALEALRLARRLREADPHGETAWRLLLTALVAAGDTLGARAEADHFEAWLRSEELDAEPASQAALKAARRVAPPAAATPGREELVAELVGREREFSLLHDAWVNAQARGAQRVHLVAESGLGKTRLTADLAARLRAARQRVVFLRATPGERFIPFSFAASIAGAAANLSGARAISPESAATLVALNPTLSSTYHVTESPRGYPTPLRIGLALLELISRVADEKPVAVLLDDLHWSDAVSRDAVGLVTSRLADEHVLLVTTARPGYAISLAERTLSLALRPLGVAEIEQLLVSMATLPPADWARTLPAALTDSTGGNPLRVLETLRLCIECGALVRETAEWRCPDPSLLAASLRQSAVIARRLSELTALEARLLLLLSVEAVPLGRAMLGKAAGGSQAELDAALATLEHRSFITDTGDAVRVVHDEIGEAVVRDADAAALASVHASLGAAFAGHENPEWRRRAIPHLAATGEWRRVRPIVVEFLGPLRRSGASLDDALEVLLGSSNTPAHVEQLKKQLSIGVRYPRLRPFAAGALAAGGLGLAAFMMAITVRDDSPPRAMLVGGVGRPDGDVSITQVRLDRDRWDATQPLTASAGKAATWKHFGNLNRMAIRPGRGSWAVEIVSPDTGEGDIELQSPSDPPRRLTWGPAQDRPGAFSPDGEYLAFLTTRWSADGQSNLASLHLRTGVVTRLTLSRATDQQARWSPDGSRIAFVRNNISDGTSELMVIDADGSNSRSIRVGSLEFRWLVGWLNPRRLLVRADSAGTPALWAIDLTSLQARRLLQSHGTAMADLDPTGSWLLLRSQAAQKARWFVLPTDRPELIRELDLRDSSASLELAFSADAAPPEYIDRMRIQRPPGPIAPGVPHRLTAIGISPTGLAVEPGVVRWRSLTPAIAQIDSLGVLIAKETGLAILEVSAGGWRTARDTIDIRRLPLALVLDELWEHAPFSRWRPYGVPLPVITRDERGRPALLNNGDGTFFSGVYLRRKVDASRGLAMDLEFSTSITEPKWQVTIAGLYSGIDAAAFEGWDHRTGYLPFRTRTSGCDVAYPDGEGPLAATRIGGLGDLIRATGNPAIRLQNGAWWRVRLQVFPDGRCGIALHGTPLVIGGVQQRPPDRETRVVLQGSSVGTRILVGRVRISTGVPTDMDWTHLAYDGESWRPTRATSMRSSP